MTRKAVVTYPCDDAHLARLRARAPGWRIVAVDSDARAGHEFVDAAVVLGNRYFLQSLPRARELEWMQSNSVGMDLLLASKLVQEGDFLISNARGPYDAELADHALAMILALLRGLASYERDRIAGQWQARPLGSIDQSRVLVFGHGGVGREVSRRLRMCGGRVTAVRRQLTGNGGHDDRVVGLEEGLALLPEADIVVLALPLTVETEKLFDRARLNALKDGAYLINISRGALIDEQALEGMLDRLGGVGLDTLRIEPPPSDHWAWRHPKVLLTPHVGRAPESPACRRFYPLFEDNLGRWANGMLPVNLVDKRRGY